MCQLSYIEHQPCGCHHFEKEPDYCDPVRQCFKFQKSNWRPIVLVRREEASFNFLVDGENGEIWCQTEDAFRPIQYTECKGIDYLKQETEEGCLWHNNHQTAGLREAVAAAEMKPSAWQKVRRGLFVGRWMLNGILNPRGVSAL